VVGGGVGTLAGKREGYWKGRGGGTERRRHGGGGGGGALVRRRRQAQRRKTTTFRDAAQAAQRARSARVSNTHTRGASLTLLPTMIARAHARAQLRGCVLQAPQRDSTCVLPRARGAPPRHLGHTPPSLSFLSLEAVVRLTIVSGSSTRAPTHLSGASCRRGAARASPPSSSTRAAH
jgi:hypothetical protein